MSGDLGPEFFGVLINDVQVTEIIGELVADRQSVKNKTENDLVSSTATWNGDTGIDNQYQQRKRKEAETNAYVERWLLYLHDHHYNLQQVWIHNL